MTDTVDVQEARTRLSELLARTCRGDDIVIVRAGVLVARLVPVDNVPPRRFGTMSFEVPPEFFEPLPEDELEAWR